MRPLLFAAATLLVASPLLAQQSISTGTLAVTAEQNRAYDSQEQVSGATTGLGLGASEIGRDGRPLRLPRNGAEEERILPAPIRRTEGGLDQPVSSEATIQQVN